MNAEEKEYKIYNCVPYQKCPKCDGQGITSKPPYIAGDQAQWDSTVINHKCDVCNGDKIIPMFIAPIQFDINSDN